jgi:AraC-like DNA-binding protein
MEILAASLIGFSLIAALILAAAYQTVYRGVPQSWLSRVSGYAMLLGFFALQLWHARLVLLTEGSAIVAFASPPEHFPSRGYCLLLTGNAIAMYWFFLGLLRPIEFKLAWFELTVPVAALLASIRVPAHLAAPLAFVFGTFYAVHLASLVHRLRAQRRWFALEWRVFAAFAAISVAVLIAGVVGLWLGPRIFVLSYSITIGASFALMLHLLLRFPDVVSKTSDAVAQAYAVSTLGKLDQLALVQQLRHVLAVDRVFEDEALSLASLARRLSVSTHQLSELINTHFGVSFSTLIRQHRITAAKTMLLEEPTASVLSVGMAVGFSSQSNFYTAFKELTGQVPGQYRKSHRHGLEDQVSTPK